MKVLLCLPPSLRHGFQIPDIGLGYIASALRKHGHEVDIYQTHGERNFDRLREKLLHYQPEVIGIKVFSMAIKAVRQVIDLSREMFPRVIIVLGGPHPSMSTPVESLSTFSSADYAICGEGEIPFPLLLDALTRGGPGLETVPGLVFRKNGEIRWNEPLLHPRLDDFDDPAWDLIDPRTYSDRWYFWAPEHPGAPLLTSRGCPYQCTFCALKVLAGNKVRRRSLERVFSEMEILRTRYGVEDFDIIDDNFLIKAGYVRQFCHGILDRGWKIRWNCCGIRLDLLDLELARLMDFAGCNIISVGYESGNKRVLEYMKKDLDPKTALAKTRLISENTNIKIMGLFILGYPTESEVEILETIRYACALPLFTANFNTFIIMPGCEEFRRLQESGEIKEVPWEQVCIEDHAYAPKGMTFKRLKQLYWLAHINFYLRPHILFGLLRYSWRKLPRFMTKSIRILLWHNV